MKAKQATPISEDKNDMKVGSIKKDMVCSTLAIPIKSELARSHRATIWTEYSTENPTLRTMLMFEKPVKLTPDKTESPATETMDRIFVTAIRTAPKRLPYIIFSTPCSFSIRKVKTKNEKATAKPMTIENPAISAKAEKIPIY